ncbi:hypothetical protein [Catenovulum sediminis]|uniref:Uncharacterized protein n=1 Tax=Catenovulum sediminis TaxID=1740262 RepID=A0ABV1RLU9_9ALTE
MTTHEARRIISFLKEKGIHGACLSDIAKATDMDLLKLKEYMNEYNELFSKVGSTDKYTLNRFGPYQGNAEQMLAFVEKYNHSKLCFDKRIIWMSSMVAVLFAVFATNIS